MAQNQELVTISIRAKAGQRDLIDQAADRVGRSRSDFMLEAACRQAENVLLASIGGHQMGGRRVMSRWFDRQLRRPEVGRG